MFFDNTISTLFSVSLRSLSLREHGLRCLQSRIAGSCRRSRRSSSSAWPVQQEVTLAHYSLAAALGSLVNMLRVNMLNMLPDTTGELLHHFL